VGSVKQVWSEWTRSATEDWPIVAGAGSVWAVLVLLLAAKGLDGLDPASYRSNLLLYLVTLAILAVLAAAWALYRARPKSPIDFLVRLITDGGGGKRFVRGVPVLAALVIFMPAFSVMKSAIPLFNPQIWDAVFIQADQAIHGRDAWRMLQPVLGYPIVTAALSIMYVVWFFVIYASSIYFCFLSVDRELRTRYFIAYFATWTICGVVLATLFASVGPCFVGPLLGDQQFDEQMAYLRGANEHYPILILQAQEFLMASRVGGNGELGGGISAMPSMHVAMATLVALSASRVSRLAAIFGWGFLLITVLASVHLAAHYALDGYVSIAVTMVLWRAAAPLARLVVSSTGHRAMQPNLRHQVGTA
jgi:hypothetical protein